MSINLSEVSKETRSDETSEVIQGCHDVFPWEISDTDSVRANATNATQCKSRNGLGSKSSKSINTDNQEEGDLNETADQADEVAASSDEEEEMQEEIKALEHMNKHLEWHCAIYRNALSKVPDGRMLVKEAITTFLEASEAERPCNTCEIQSLKMEIEEQQELITSLKLEIGLKRKKNY